MVKLCSACLLGVACRYDGKSKTYPQIIQLSEKELLVPVCPEQLGGQATPRPDAWLDGGTGADVLEGKARVLEPGNKDVTQQFIKGAEETLNIAKFLGIKEAILKQRSPSCGNGQIYDGPISLKKIIKGDGVAAALLKKNGIKVISEEELQDA